MNNKNNTIMLIAGIIMVCLFLISWLVFKHITVIDWLILGLGIVDIAYFVYVSTKGKNIQ